MLDGGCATVDSVGDLSMAVTWSDNCYNSGAGGHEATGRVLQTTAPRNSSMRSPGVLQSHLVREVAINRIAHACGRHVLDVQEANFYVAGDRTPYSSRPLGSDAFNWTLPELWATQRPKLLARLADAEAFNATNAFRKRGAYAVPTKYIMALSGWKIPALINVYADGSVRVLHGGCEIGQGIHTKVAAVVAYVLDCDLDVVSVGATSTEKTPNSSCTGGSGTSESSCNAARLAAEVLRERLAPFRAGCADVADGTHGAGWADACAAAVSASVHLSATGWNDVQGNPDDADDPDYAIYGVAVAEVEIDCLSGEIEISSVDVLMDEGSSLNTDVDVGQLEGGLVMALGWLLTEDCVVDATGAQSGDGTWDYKPFGSQDVPLELHVSMLANTPNPSPLAVLGSKASGEPPMQLAAAVYFAIRAAVAAFRSDVGETSWFDLALPATPEAIRDACGCADAQLTLGS